MKKTLILFSVIILVLLNACSNKSNNNSISNDSSTQNNPEYQEINKMIITPEKKNEELIRKIVKKRYEENFAVPKNDLFPIGLNILNIEKKSDEEMVVCLFASFKAYEKDKTGEYINVSGSGPSLMVLKINPKTEEYQVLFEALTDKDYGTDLYKEVVPEKFQNDIIENFQTFYQKTLEDEQNVYNKFVPQKEEVPTKKE